MENCIRMEQKTAVKVKVELIYKNYQHNTPRSALKKKDTNQALNYAVHTCAFNKIRNTARRARGDTTT